MAHQHRHQHQLRQLAQDLLQHQGLARRHRRAHSTVTALVQELATNLASSLDEAIQVERVVPNALAEMRFIA